MARPNPNDSVVQGIYSADFAARYLGFLGPGGLQTLLDAIAGNQWLDALAALQSSNDPDVERMKGVLRAYRDAHRGQSHPFGYYATIVIANTDAGKTGWSPDPEPWGTPGT